MVDKDVSRKDVSAAGGDNKPTAKSDKARASAERAERLAASLRANLRRRKSQSRARNSGNDQS